MEVGLENSQEQFLYNSLIDVDSGHIELMSFVYIYISHVQCTLYMRTMYIEVGCKQAC